MVAGTDLNAVLGSAWIHREGWLPTKEAAIFLARHDLLFGMFMEFNPGLMKDGVPRQIDFHYRFADMPAIVTVKSERYHNWNHAVVWDNRERMFRDPHPSKGELTDPTEYVITEWWPITIIRPDS
jgi:hypothetical protein